MNEAVLLGVLMDSADARHAERPSLGERANLVGHGLMERARVAVRPGTRDLVAGAAVGCGFGFTLVYAVLYGWVRSDFYNGTAIAGPGWFLPAWTLLVAATLFGRFVVRAAATLIVVVVAIAVPVLRVGPFVFLPGVSAGYGGQHQGFHLEWGAPLQVLPAASANVAIVIMLALLTLTGRPGRRDAVVGGVVLAAVFGLVFAAAVFLSGWPNAMRDAYAWTWLDVTNVPTVGGAVVIVVGALLVSGWPSETSARRLPLPSG